MLRLNSSENFEAWADTQLTSPSPEQILLAIEDIEDDLNDEEYDEILELLAH